MANRIDYLFQEWAQLGGEALVARSEKISARDAHQVIAESTAYCRESGRLTWITLSWLIHHVEEIADETLIEETKSHGDLTVLGVLCDAALLRVPHPKFQKIIRACQPAPQLEPFFKRVARSALALKLTQENPLDVFRRWNYLCNELQYL
jgi:hypothetical protein